MVALVFHVYVGLLIGLLNVIAAVPLLRPQVVALTELFSISGVDDATDTVATAEQPLFVTVTV